FWNRKESHHGLRASAETVSVVPRPEDPAERVGSDPCRLPPVRPAGRLPLQSPRRPRRRAGSTGRRADRYKGHAVVWRVLKALPFEQLTPPGGLAPPRSPAILLIRDYRDKNCLMPGSFRRLDASHAFVPNSSARLPSFLVANRGKDSCRS